MFSIWSLLRPPLDWITISVSWRIPSAWLMASTLSLLILSCSALASASLTMFSIWSLLRPPLDWMTICCSFPVPLSLAWTFTIPLASKNFFKSTLLTSFPELTGDNRRQFFTEFIGRIKEQSQPDEDGFQKAYVDGIQIFG